VSIQLKPKDLRDGTEIAAKTDEPAVVRKLLRHTLSDTTNDLLRKKVVAVSGVEPPTPRI
jgi:hypothetical protein